MKTHRTPELPIHDRRVEDYELLGDADKVRQRRLLKGTDRHSNSTASLFGEIEYSARSSLEGDDWGFLGRLFRPLSRLYKMERLRIKIRSAIARHGRVRARDNRWRDDGGK